MRIKCITENLFSEIGIFARVLASSQQTDQNFTVLDAKSVFCLSKKCQSTVIVRNINISLCAYLLLRPLDCRILTRGTHKISELNSAIDRVAPNGGYKFRAEQRFPFSPIRFCFKFQIIFDSTETYTMRCFRITKHFFKFRNGNSALHTPCRFHRMEFPNAVLLQISFFEIPRVAIVFIEHILI